MSSIRYSIFVGWRFITDPTTSIFLIIFADLCLLLPGLDLWARAIGGGSRSMNVEFWTHRVPTPYAHTHTLKTHQIKHAKRWLFWDQFGDAFLSHWYYHGLTEIHMTTIPMCGVDCWLHIFKPAVYIYIYIITVVDCRYISIVVDGCMPLWSLNSMIVLITNHVAFPFSSWRASDRLPWSANMFKPPWTIRQHEPRKH